MVHELPATSKPYKGELPHACGKRIGPTRALRVLVGGRAGARPLALRYKGHASSPADRIHKNPENPRLYWHGYVLRIAIATHLLPPCHGSAIHSRSDFGAQRRILRDMRARALVSFVEGVSKHVSVLAFRQMRKRRRANSRASAARWPAARGAVPESLWTADQFSRFARRVLPAAALRRQSRPLTRASERLPNACDFV